MTALRWILGILVIVILMLVNTVVVMWCERKWAGHMQSRLGPMRTGWHGVLQPFADALKMLGKETITPSGVDRVLFSLAPVLAYMPSILVYCATPWVAEFAGYSFDAGIFMVFAVAALFPVAILIAGWSSRNKYSVLGAFRAAAQQISYEVPMILAVLGVIMLAGSMRLSAIVEAQAHVWNIVTQPFAFVLFFIGTIAELNRTPFDMPEAESELVAGYMTEYSSMQFAMFFLAEYSNLFTWSLFTALLFLGGWGGPGPAWLGFVWLFAKAYLMVFAIIWVRWALPRLRVDQLMEFGWKVLIPAALVNMFFTALGMVTNVFVLVIMQVALLAGFVWLVGSLGDRAGEHLRGTRAAHGPLRAPSARAEVTRR
jgi:NADH-quinone oxidoreductase subunit H